MQKKLLLFSLLWVGLVVQANNIQVSNVSLTKKDNLNQVRFDLSWENSWRVSSAAPNNWDAAWIFVKYREGTGPWLHALLGTTGSTSGNGTPATIQVPPDGLGAFVYRSADGTGTFEIKGAMMPIASSLTLTNNIQLKVYAIEMVYVPAGDFYVGDGLSNTSGISGYAANTSGAPLFVNGNDIVPTVSCCFTNPEREVQGLTSPLVGYPNGHRAMYVMKYPITQIQYVEFLNTIARVDQDRRVLTTTVGNYMHNTALQTTPAFRNGIRLIADPGGTAPRTYACDLTPSSAPYTDVNQENDGLHIACNWLNVFDVSAYLFWSALRPMTVMEFEKTARGPGVIGSPPTAAEYVWGNTTAPTFVLTDTEFDNKNTPSEGCASSCGNQTGGYFATPTGKLAGPVRVGALATDITDRASSGAGYYGVMHLGDNVHDLCINLYDTGTQSNNANGGGGGRRFKFDQHGTGNLTNYVTQNTAWDFGWPLYVFESNSAVYRGAAVKGSCFGHGNLRRQISRHDLYDDGTGDFSTEVRQSYYGGRGVRTAP
jgi:formylglycine-generating enzyme required for sulfatase activity